ncbi:hypothetical protein ACI65C_010907 [Semiaphis heraclei]
MTEESRLLALQCRLCLRDSLELVIRPVVEFSRKARRGYSAGLGIHLKTDRSASAGVLVIHDDRELNRFFRPISCSIHFSNSSHRPIKLLSSEIFRFTLACCGTMFQLSSDGPPIVDATRWPLSSPYKPSFTPSIAKNCVLLVKLCRGAFATDATPTSLTRARTTTFYSNTSVAPYSRPRSHFPIAENSRSSPTATPNSVTIVSNRMI